MPDNTSALRKDEAFDVPALSGWIQQNTGIEVSSIHISRFAGGFSNLTYLLTINDDVSLVLRRPPIGANIKSGHDMSREFKIISALYPSYKKVPKPVAFCDDSSIIGSEFYLMHKVDGLILRSGLHPEPSLLPEQIQHVFRSFNDNFAALHDLDYNACGLADLGFSDNYPARQIQGWTKRYYHAKTDDIQSVESLLSWLGNHIPAMSRTCLVHNDYKYDNVILDPDTYNLIAVLDWEMSTIGDPLMDLGSSLAYWTNRDDPDWFQHLHISPTNIQGNPSREEFLHTYADKSGLDPGNGVIYYVYGLMKLAVIAQQIYARYISGYASDKRFAELKKVVEACGIMGLQCVAKKRIDNLF